jgi:colanic acid/amylovoran biosynthesis protein WcaK/AmsJ
MKKIAILHAANTFNNGSFMLLINCIQLLNNAYKDIELHIEFNSGEDKQRLLKEIDCEKSIKDLKLDICKISDKSFIKKGLNLYHKINTHTKNLKKMGVSEIIILGGDDFSEYYKGKHIRFDLKRIRNYSKEIPTLFLSQSIGPFYSCRKQLAKKCFANIRILCREDISYTYCSQELGLKNVYPSNDFAFLDLPKQNKIHEKKKQIAIVPGGNYRLYTKDYDSYIKIWQEIIKTILKNTKLKEHKLLLIPHVTRPEDDRRIIKELKQANSRIEIIDKELRPSQLRQVIGESDFVISSRMHASISSFNQGNAAIVFAHSIKYHGIIGNTIKLPKLIIPETAWKNKSVVSSFKDSLGYLIDNQEEIQTQIKINTNNIKENLKKQLQKFFTYYG